MPHSDPLPHLTPARRTTVAVALLGCAFLAMLDGTVIGTSLPRIVSQLGGTDTWYVWLVTAYLLTSSISVPVYGRLSDIHGRKGLLLAGLTLFLAGSLACALAGSMPALIIFRAIQGLGGGALLVLGMALVRDLYPPERTDGLLRMQTVLPAMMVIGLIGGPIIGGVLTDQVGWRWTFGVNLPIGIAALAVIGFALPATARPSDSDTARLDIAGIAVGSTGLASILIGLSLRSNPIGGRTADWLDPQVAGPLLAGLALLATLPVVERRAHTPILPPRLFGAPGYPGLLTAGFLFQVAGTPVGVFMPVYFQHVRGFTALTSGLLLIPMLAGMVLANRITAAVVLRTGHTKPVLVAGAALLTVGTAAFAALRTDTPVVGVGVALLLCGLGTGPAMGGVTIATQNAVPRADMGTATAGSALTKQVGGSVGLAFAQTVALGSAVGATTVTAGISGAVSLIGGTAGALAILTLALTRGISVPVPAGPQAAKQPS